MSTVHSWHGDGIHDGDLVFCLHYVIESSQEF